MARQAVVQPVKMLVADFPARWRGLRLPYKVAALASALVLACMVHLGVVVAGHVRDNLVQQSAAAAAMHMDSFVARHVQDLATKPTLSQESQDALQKLLSPAAMHRPVVAFRIWKDDTVSFSNERDLIGKTFERSAARGRAWMGHVAFELAQPDGDDDEQVSSLNVPVLEIYAPVREGGTGRIIALVEIYEIAVALEREVTMHQIASWATIGSIGLTIVLLLFSMANSGTIERNRFLGRIAELSFLQERGEQVRQRMSHAGLQVSHMTERSLHQLGAELQEGPGQLVALAMLKFDALNQLMVELETFDKAETDERMQDLEAIRRALRDTLGHIQQVSGTLLVADFDQLTVTEVLTRAARQYQKKAGAAVRVEFKGVPEHLPLPVKTCLYRIALEGLDTCAGATEPSLVVSCDGEAMVLQFASKDRNPRFGEALRNRIEAVGGHFSIAGIQSGTPTAMAELLLSKMDVANDLRVAHCSRR